MTPRGSLATALREAIRSGEFERLRERLAEGTVLDTSSEAGRLRLEDADAVIAHLARPGPGRIHDWDAREWPTGIALSFEWEGVSGIDRRRWYVRSRDGIVEEIWSTAARPASAAAPTEAVEPPRALLDRLGAGRVEPLSHGGNSGAALLRAIREGGETFVLKRVGGGDSDWLARATGDKGRTALMAEAGAFERMPGSVASGVIDVERAGDAAWIAMRDVGAALLPSGSRLSRDQSRRILTAAAEIHRRFRDAVPNGAASLADRLGMSSPAIGHAERANPDLLPKQFEQGWDAFGEVVNADVAEPVLELVAEPGALAARLLRAHGQPTLIHGDLRGDNLGWEGDRLVLIDWDLATAGTPGVEFAWYLAHTARRVAASHDEIEADHRTAQADELADEELELGLISGLVQYGWRIAHSARVHPDPAETAWGYDELGWWVPRVRAALERVQ